MSRSATSRFIAFTWFPPQWKEAKHSTETKHLDMSHLLKEFKCDHAKWQIEKSPETGKLHVQGCVAMDETRTRAQQKKLLVPVMDDTVHVELCKKDYLASVRYCGKSETRVAGPWEIGGISSSGKPKVSLLTDMKSMGTKEWQKTAEETLVCSADTFPTWTLCGWMKLAKGYGPCPKCMIRIKNGG